MPFFMERHEFSGLTAAAAAAADVKDLEIQDQFGVRILTWFDEERQTAFCLAKALVR